MKLIEFEGEEVGVAEAVVLAVESLDLVIGSFQGTGGNWIVIPGQDSLGVLEQRPGEIVEDADAGTQGLMISVEQLAPRSAPIGLLPDLPQVFLEIVGSGQRLIQPQGLA